MISRLTGLRIGARYFVAVTLILLILVSSFGIERFSLAQSDETPLVESQAGEVNDQPAVPASLIPVTGVAVTPDSATIKAGKTQQLAATIVPADATNRAVTWTSSNVHVATVDTDGLVAAVAGGDATITATTADGGFNATGTITVFANDHFGHRVALSGLSGKISGGNAGATKESGEPNHGGNIGGSSVWFEWTAPVSGSVEFTTYGSGFDTLLAVYTGTMVNSLRRVAENNNRSADETTSLVSFTARAGVHYLIAADGFNAAADPANAGSGRINFEWRYTAIPVTGVRLDRSNLLIESGKDLPLRATVEPAAALGDPAFNNNVTWASSNENVAMVDENGLITAVSPGRATITVTTASGARKAACRVEVIGQIYSFSIVPGSAIVEQGMNAQLNAKVLFVDGSSRIVNAGATWSSSDPSLAAVSRGRVRGVAVTGAETPVTIRTEFAGHEDSATISVIPRLRRLETPSPVLHLEIGSKTELPAAIFAVFRDRNLPRQDVTADVTWSSRNASIASVDENGLITAGATPGRRTTITAAYAAQRINITVHVIPVVEALELSPEPLFMEVGQRADIRVRARYAGENVSRQANIAPQAVWSSPDPAIVTVTGGRVRAVALGEATLTVTFGRRTMTIPVTVIPRIKSIIADQTSLNLLVGESAQVKIWADYREFLDEWITARCTWTSTSEQIATVDKSGKITAVGAGRATIVAAFGAHRVNITVNVRTALPKALSVTHGDISELFGVYRVHANQVTGLMPGEDIYFYIWSAQGDPDDRRRVEGRFNHPANRWEATVDIFYHGYHLGEYIAEAWVYDHLDRPLIALGRVSAEVDRYTGLKIIKPDITWNGELQPLSGPVEKLIQHHMAHRTWDFFEVHDYHKSLRHEGRSWFGIGYNYWIGFDGTIFEGRGMMRGAQAGAFWNGRSIGIGYQGHFDHQQMTEEQVESGAWLNAKLVYTENLRLSAIIGHRNVQPTLCPGRNFRMDDLRNRAAALLGLKAEGTAIVGPAEVDVKTAQAWALRRGAHQRFINIAPIYWKYGELTGIRPEVLYAQSAKETAFGRFGGAVTPDQNNWAGIKTASGGPCNERNSHQIFPTPEEGVRAHFNHMSAYVGSPPVGEPHPRYFVVASLSWAGTVRYVEELGGKWAPAADYGESIINNYLQDMMR